MAIVPFTHRDPDRNLVVEMSATGDDWLQARLTLDIYPNSPGLHRTFSLAFRIENLRKLFRDAKTHDTGTRPSAICQGPEPDRDVAYFLYLIHWPAHDVGRFALHRMRTNVGRSRRTMHDTVFDHVNAGDFEQLYEKIMREPAPLPVPNPEPEPIVIQMPAPTPEPIVQAAPPVADDRVHELEQRILILEQQVRERDQMIAFLKQRG